MYEVSENMIESAFIQSGHDKGWTYCCSNLEYNWKILIYSFDVECCCSKGSFGSMFCIVAISSGSSRLSRIALVKLIIGTGASQVSSFV